MHDDRLLYFPNNPMNLKKIAAACALALAALVPAASRAQSADGHPDWPGAGQLFVGTNYQPFDRTREQIVHDIQRMKQAGFKVVRMGDLSWDSFEPADGKFDFTLFDWIMDYMTQAHNAYEPLFKDNIDVAVIHIGHEDLSRYKLVIVPGMYLLDAASRANLRKFVADGGTAVMTAQSDKVDDNNQWFDTPLPGGLTDVFGLRTNAFYGAGALQTTVGGTEVKAELGPYEVLEPSTADVLARFANVDGKVPAITVNRFGKGRAIYVATAAQPQIMRPLYRQLYASLGITPGPQTPDGVYARVVDGRTLYVNTTGAAKDVAVDGEWNGVLTGKRWSGVLRLAPLGVDLLER
jgi:beta-galactosidase GanA